MSKLKRLQAKLIPNQLVRMRLRVKHGVMSETNSVYEMLRRYPPPGPPAQRELKELHFPWDDLEDEYRNKTKEAGYPFHVVPVEDPDADPAIEFAQRQWRRMKKEGITKEEAYDMVMAEYEKERREAIAKVTDWRKKFRRWHRGEREAPMSPKLYREWLKVKDTGDKLTMDSWLATLLGWRWRLERIFDEEAAYLDTWGVKNVVEDRCALAFAMARFRRDCFRTREDVQDDCDDPLDDVRSYEFEIDPDDVDGSVDPVFDKLQSRAEARKIDEWTTDEVAELDAYLATAFDNGLVVIDPASDQKIDNDLPIERLRLEVFPELCPTYRRRPRPVLGGTNETSAKKKDDDTTEPSPEGSSELFDASNHPTFDSNKVLLVRTTKIPKDIPKALAKAGIFPEFDVDKTLEEDLLKDEKDRVIPEKLAAPLREAKEPDSYLYQQIDAARRAFRNDRFLERIYAKLDTRPEDKLLREEEEEQQQEGGVGASQKKDSSP